MKLNERIARSIDPTAWTYADAIRDQKPHTAASTTFKSRAAAQRVINALGLDEVTVIISAPAPSGPYFASEIRAHHSEEIRPLTADENAAYLTGHMDVIHFPQDDE